jgi:hypothetical protein
VTEPAWLSEVRGRVHADAALQRVLLCADPTEFAEALVAVAGSAVTLEDVSLAMLAARREWLERWIS